MSKITSEKCEWCKGSKVDPEGESLGNPYPCIDCQGTGFKYGYRGLEKDLEEMEIIETAMEEAGNVFGVDPAYFGEEGEEEIDRQIEKLGYDPEYLKNK